MSRGGSVKFLRLPPGQRTQSLNLRLLASRALILEKQDAGYHLVLDTDGKAGDAYAYRLDAGPPLPVPASRAQEGDVHGRSVVVDPNTYRWEDAGWKRPRFRDLVIYDATHQIKDDSELHILAEMTQAVRARGGYAIAEDSRHETRIVTECAQGGLGFDAVRADSFHHSARVSQTQERWSVL